MPNPNEPRIKLRNRLKPRFWTDADGATAVEYGLVIALLCLAILASISVAGTNISGVFTRISNALAKT